MSDSINYKIQKYTYKLNYAKNKKERELYSAKLRQYQQQTGGASFTESINSFFEELTKTTNDSFGEATEQLKDLSSGLDAIRKKLEELCKRGECEDKKAELGKLETSLQEILKLVERNTKTQGENVQGKVTELSERIREAKEGINKLSEIECPPSEGVSVNKLPAAFGQKKEEEKVVEMRPAEVTTLTQPAKESASFPEVAAAKGLVKGRSPVVARKTAAEAREVKAATGGSQEGGRKVGGKRRLKY